MSIRLIQLLEVSDEMRTSHVGPRDFASAHPSWEIEDGRLVVHRSEHHTSRHPPPASFLIRCAAAMTSQDVRSILNLPQAGPSAPAPKKLAKVARKPDGISRELYALIGDNAPSLAEVQASTAAVRYRDRPKLKGKKVKW